jgi:hypothetical protein
MRRRFQDPAERFDLLHQVTTGIGGQPVAQSFHRGMGAVRYRKGVIDEDVAERRELSDEIGIVALLAGVEPRILQAEHVARPHGIHCGARFLADAILGEGNRTAKHIGNSWNERLERMLAVRPFRTSEMRQQDHLAASCDDVQDGGSRARDAGYIHHLAVLDRHIEIGAQEHPLALDVDPIKRAQRRHRAWIRSVFPSQPRYRPCDWRSPTRYHTTTSRVPACRPSPWSGRWRTPTNAHRG